MGAVWNRLDQHLDELQSGGHLSALQRLRKNEPQNPLDGYKHVQLALSTAQLCWNFTANFPGRF